MTLLTQHRPRPLGRMAVAMIAIAALVAGLLSLTFASVANATEPPAPTIVADPEYPEPNAPTCEADGSLATLPVSDFYSGVYNPAFTGPGDYTVTFTTFEGFTFDGGTELSYGVEVLPRLSADNPLCEDDTPPVDPPDDTPKKVFVCKYVGTPGTDERLQTGQNPISVSINAIQNNQWNGVIPGYFSDAQDRSYVLEYDTGQPEPSIDDCPGPDVPPPPAECLEDPEFSYTFTGATGAGVITVTNGTTGQELCEPLFVRAASWEYDQGATQQPDKPAWPQTLNGFVDTTVDSVGSFNFGPPELDGCRQYDVYASFVGFDELELPNNLLGPNNPFEPDFLHQVLPGDGPSPTWSYTTLEGCNAPPPTNTECVTFTEGGTSTNLNANGWVDYDTRATGSATYVDGGLFVATTGTTSTDKVSWARAFPATSLALLGDPDVDFTNDRLGQAGWFQYEPGINIFVNLGNGVTGTLVSEEVYGHENLWVPGGANNANLRAAAPHDDLTGQGSNFGGTINEWLALYPDATFAGFAFAAGSGVKIEGTIHSITIGCTVFRFDFEPEVVADPPAPVAGEPTCDADGTLPALLNGEFYTAQYNRAFDGPGLYLATFTTIEGYTFDGGTELSFEVEVLPRLSADDPLCVNVIKTPPAPVAGEPTCDADGTLPALEDGEFYTAEYDRAFDGPGTYTVTFTANEGYSFEEGTSVSYEIEVLAQLDGEDCPTGSPGDGGLASTGLAEIIPWLGFAALLALLAGIGIVAVRRKTAVMTDLQ